MMDKELLEAIRQVIREELQQEIRHIVPEIVRQEVRPIVREIVQQEVQPIVREIVRQEVQPIVREELAPFKLETRTRFDSIAAMITDLDSRVTRLEDVNGIDRNGHEL